MPCRGRSAGQARQHRSVGVDAMAQEPDSPTEALNAARREFPRVQLTQSNVLPSASISSAQTAPLTGRNIEW